MINYKECGFDSQEELLFSEWLRELGVKVSTPRTFYLSEEVKIDRQMPRSIKQTHLLQKHDYTCDFSIEMNEMNRAALEALQSNNFILVDISSGLIQKSLKNALIISKGYLHIDIKAGNFMSSTRGSDQRFGLNQKWVYSKYGIYINSLVPQKLFEKTFYPEIWFWSPTGKERFKKVRGKQIPYGELYKRIRDVL